MQMFTTNLSSNTINRTTASRSGKCLQKSCWVQRRVGLQESYLIQEVLSVERIPLGRTEAGVAIYSDRPSVRPQSCLPGSRKINSKVKGSGQECPLHASGGACSADSRGR